MKKHNYIGRVLEYLMIIVNVRFSLLLKGLFLFLIVYTSIQIEVEAQDSFNDEAEVTSFAYDEIPVLVIVEGYKNF